MPEIKYLVRTPLLDPKQQVIGYKLSWQKSGKSSGLTVEADLPQLLDVLAEPANNSQLGLLFLDARSSELSSKKLQSMSPKNTVLMLNQTDLLNASHVTSAMSLHEHGFGLALCDVDIAFLASNESLLALVTYIEVSVGHPDLAALTHLARQTQSNFSLVVNQFPDWREFDAGASRGLNGFFQNLCLTPRKLSPMGKLGPQTVLILQLMKMVQENADVRHLEKILQRDAALSFSLLRYINSASFGIKVEIQSLRHAVAMLGYTALFSWLSLLLARTSNAGFSPALLQAAIVRGRFAELLGQGFFPRNETENLFVVGMFSLLDQLLGVPMNELLSQILLPDAMTQALISREGQYGAFLALVEACEREDACASDLADALFLTAARVNQTHVSALAWAQSLKL